MFLRFFDVRFRYLSIRFSVLTACPKYTMTLFCAHKMTTDDNSSNNELGILKIILCVQNNIYLYTLVHKCGILTIFTITVF